MGQFSMAIFTPLSSARLVNSPKTSLNFGIAASMGVLLMLFVYAPLLLVNKLTRAKAET